MKIIPLKLRRWGFTLVELLVLIGLVGLMGVIGVMLPACSKPKGLSDRARSISNQGQIGKAYAGYVNDNLDYYPEVFGLAGVGGGIPEEDAEIGRDGKPATGGNFLLTQKQATQEAAGTFNAYSAEHQKRLGAAVSGASGSVRDIHGASTPAEKRPLNEYVNNNYEIFHDPADIGGTAFNVDSCYEAFGNSYQPAVADDMFRVKRVLGERTEDAGTPYRGPGWQKGHFNHSSKSEADDPYEGRSMRQSEMINPSNKIIQGDWNWPYDGASSWHAAKGDLNGGAGEAGHVMLYGDGHAEYFIFPPTRKMMEWFERPTRSDGTIDNEKWREDSGEPFDYVDPKYKWW